jgi:hypothetical protein
MTPRLTRHLTAHLTPLAIVLAAATATPTAVAQNALDPGQQNDSAYRSSRGSGRDRANEAVPQGRALDANSRVGSGGINEVGTDWSAEIALRNAIVTGNVGGGKAFRGDIGYSDTADFRADTGADDFFEFQRDAATSGVIGLRGVSGLQNVLGRSASAGAYSGEFIVRRAAFSTRGVDVVEGPQPAAPLLIDPYGGIRGALRSTSDAVLTRSTRPAILAQVSEARSGKTGLFVASSLQGARPLSPTNAAIDWNRLNNPQLPRVPTITPPPPPEDGALQPGETPRVGQQVRVVSPFESLNETLRERSDAFRAQRLNDPELRVEPEVPGDGTPRETPEDERETSVERFNRELDELRNDLLRRLETREAPAPAAPRTAESDAEIKPGDDIVRRARELIDHGQARVDRLLADEGVTDLHALHMRRGEEALAEGRFFEAEEFFTAAIASKPDDPMASAGRVNAEVGAGLYRSAAFNLRTLFSRYPEMIPALFAENLFPSEARVTQIRDALREHVEKRRPFARDAALLMAYIGFQRQRAGDIEAAFNAMDVMDIEQSTTPTDLERVLREVWLSDPAAPAR